MPAARDVVSVEARLRHEWDVVFHDARPERGFDPADFLARIAPMVADLVPELPLGAVEHLEVLGPIAKGERVLVTATREGEVLKLVARRRKGAVVLCGALRFGLSSVTQPSMTERIERGQVLVRTSFAARNGAEEALLQGTLAAWVHSSAWTSAQGSALLELERLEVFHVPEKNEGLQLSCAVTGRNAKGVTVESEVRGASGRVVAQARSRFK